MPSKLACGLVSLPFSFHTPGLMLLNGFNLLHPVSISSLSFLLKAEATGAGSAPLQGATWACVCVSPWTPELTTHGAQGLKIQEVLFITYLEMLL